MLADGKISVQDYSIIKTRYEKQLIDLGQQLGNFTEEGDAIESLLQKGIQQVKNLSNLYRSGDLDLKVRLLSSIFPEKFIFDGEKCRTPRINELLLRILLINKGSRKIKAGQLSKKLELSRWVESTDQISNSLVQDIEIIVNLKLYLKNNS